MEPIQILADIPRAATALQHNDVKVRDRDTQKFPKIRGDEFPFEITGVFAALHR